MELISIIVPVYKTEKYLARCLESIIHQTYKNIEIILIDDGSPDNSGRLCDEYAQLDTRIKVIHKENGGVSSARNIGLKYANGQYVTFVDSDDWIELDMYEKLLSKLKEQNVDIVRCGYYKDEGKSVKKEDFIFQNDIRIDLVKKRREIINLYACGKMYAGICFILVKKEIIDKINNFNSGIALGEDLLFDIELICVASSIYMYNERFYHYYTNIESATQNLEFTTRNIVDLSALYNEIVKLLQDYNYLDSNNKSMLSFSFFYKIYSQLVLGISVPKNLEIVDCVLNDENIIKIINNMENIHLKLVNKILIYLIKRKDRKLLYYYCKLYYFFKYYNRR